MGELTPLAISALALLNEKPMHPYEMYRLLVERREDRIVKVRPGSLYHTVERLAEAELVRSTGTDREGNRPERTTYAITARGKRALTKRIAELLHTPLNEYPSFPVALGESHNLDATAVIKHLAQRAAELQTTLDELQQLIGYAREHDIPEAYWLATEYLHAMTTTERDWINRLASRIESKDLPWPTR